MMKNEKEYINYLLENEVFFINILDKFNNNYEKIPKDIGIYPYFENDSIDSITAFSENGYYYPFIKDKYLAHTAEYLSKNINNIFSIYGHKETVKLLTEKMLKTKRYENHYYFMKLEKADFKSFLDTPKDFISERCNLSDFEKLKDIQYQYHKEEVYAQNSYYPYNAEMNSLKEMLKNKLVFSVFHKTQDNAEIVSKANINGESPNYFQIGGIFTKKNFRNQGLSKLCLSNLINYIFCSCNKKGIILFVKKENIAAIKLYEKLGFTIEYETTLCYY